MDKKDIYEHLAKIYLDASLKGSSRIKARKPFFTPAVIGISVASAVVLILLSLFFFFPKSPRNLQTVLEINQNLMRINYNFDPAKKETISFAFNKMDMSKFKAVEFRAKRQNYADEASLRVEISNGFKERSEVYVKSIPHVWTAYRFPLQDFKRISDWSDMRELAFSVEEWNSKEKNGLVLIENVRFVR